MITILLHEETRECEHQNTKIKSEKKKGKKSKMQKVKIKNEFYE